MKAAGVIPGIDVLRAQVELQAQQQRLIFYQNEFEKQKLNQRKFDPNSKINYGKLFPGEKNVFGKDEHVYNPTPVIIR